MGLDMYLNEELYIGANYEHREVKGTVSITVAGIKQNIDISKINTITLSTMYWRKANQIHGYFMSDEEDDVSEIFLTGEKLKKLLLACREVKESLKGQKLVNKTKDNEKYQEYENTDIANNLLPPCEGFFFGTYHIDEDYFYDIENTIKMIESLPLDYEDRYYKYISCY